MKFEVSRTQPAEVDADCLIACIDTETPVGESLGEIDRAAGGLLARLDENGELPRKTGKTLMLHQPPGLKARRLLITGLGKPDKLGGPAFVKACKAAGKALRQSRAASAHFVLPASDFDGRDAAWKARQAALALDHADYVYAETRTPEEDEAPPTERASFSDGPGVDKALAEAAAIAAGVRYCRRLGDLPPNVCNPEYLAETARDLAAELDGLEVEVLDENDMEALGMRALLAVAGGSANPPRLIRLRWSGGPAGQAPAALVGKGVTFDTGGISIKPRDLMEQMKFDMCGAAATLGAMEAVARLKLPLNVEGIIAAVENMPDGKAYRPGDVITAMNGKTIEVHNTDAEGRMILADALTWTARECRPEVMVDLATLTGACVVALGHHASAVMTADDELAGELLAAGIESADRAWRLPLWDDYQEQLDTPFADMKNIGGMPAGTITAGCFLSRFTEERRWAHIDIAGSAWQWGKAESASGRPVGMLVAWLMGRAGRESGQV